MGICGTFKYYDFNAVTYVQARSCLYAKNQLLAHHFGKKKIVLLALKNILLTWEESHFFSVINNHYNVFYMRSGRRE